MISRISIVVTTFAVLGLALLNGGMWATKSAVGQTVPPPPVLSVAPSDISVNQSEGEVTQQTVTLSNTSTETISYTVSAGSPFVPFSAGRIFYGANPSGTAFALKVVALQDDTSVQVTNLADGTLIGSTASLNKYSTWQTATPYGAPFKVQSDKPVVAYHSTFTSWSHNTFMPSVDSGAFGTEHIFYLNAIGYGAWAGKFYLFALDAATVTFTNPSGTVVWMDTVEKDQYREIDLPSGVYHVQSSGRVAMQTAVENGYTLVPSTTNQGTGRQFYFAVHEGSARTGFAVFAYDNSLVKAYSMDTDSVLYEKIMTAGEYWWLSDLGSQRIHLVSTGDVEIWSGSMEWGTEIQNLGDDISVAGGRNGRQYYVHSLADGSVVVALQDSTVVTIDSVDHNLDADDYLYLEGCCHFRNIVSNKPIVIQTFSTGDTSWNDVGTYLSASDSMSGDCQWLKPPFETSTILSSSTVDIELTIDTHNVAPGTYICDVAFVDNAQSNAPAISAVTLSVPNSGPSFTSTPVTAAVEDENYTYDVVTADADVGDTRTITGLTVPAWLALTDHADGTATLSGTPANSNVGTNTVNLQVIDRLGATATQQFDIEVANTNDAPGFTSYPETDAIEDEAYTYLVQTSDVDTGDTRAITGLTVPAWLALVDSGDGTATLSGTPTNDDVGPNPVQLQVEDAAGAKAQQEFTLTVFNTNDAPKFTSVPVLWARLDAEYMYNIVTADVDVGDTRTISIPTRPSWLLLGDNGDGTATLSGTPTIGDKGNHVVVLEVQDVGGLGSKQEFTITASEAGTVSGHVFEDKNGDGQPDDGEGIAGATVTLKEVSAAVFSNPVTTDEGGVYVFEDVPVGSYTVSISAPGYQNTETEIITVEKDKVSEVASIALEKITIEGVSVYLPVTQTLNPAQSAGADIDR